MRSAPTVLLAALGLAWAAPAAAQSPTGGADEVAMALDWARDGWGSPIVCRFGDDAKRGVRRVIVVPGPPTSEVRVDRITFYDVEAREAERCFNEIGADEPNVIGTLLFTYLPSRPHSDTPDRDFKQDLKSGGLSYSIVSGRLRIGSNSAAPETLREVDFAHGKLRLTQVQPGTDDARRLADFEGRRQLRLEVEAPDGTRLSMPIAEFERR